MSEILRAVLDATCAYSAPTFYNVALFQPILGGQTVMRLNGRLQCKADRWFLMTGATLYSVAGNPRYINLFQFETFNITNLNTSKTYFLDPANMIEGNMGENAMNALTLPEYILWEPNSLIGVDCLSFAFTADYFNYVVLTGIEYAK